MPRKTKDDSEEPEQGEKVAREYYCPHCDKTWVGTETECPTCERPYV